MVNAINIKFHKSRIRTTLFPIIIPLNGDAHLIGYLFAAMSDYNIRIIAEHSPATSIMALKRDFTYAIILIERRGDAR